MDEQSKHILTELDNFPNILDNIKDGFWLVSETGDCIYINQRQAEIFGKSKQEIINNNIWELFPELKGTDIERQFQQILTQKIANHFEYLDPKQQCWYEYRVNPTEAGLAIFTIDITERKQTDQTLQESNALRLSDERFRLAARAVNGIVYDWDVQTGAVYRSEGLYSMLGIHPTDVPQNRNWWTERIHPDDIERLSPVFPSLQQGNDDRYDIEYRVRHQDGHWIDVWDRGYLIRDDDGQILRVVGFTSDITDRKQAEQEKQQLLEQIRTEREFLEAVLQQMPAGVMVAEASTGNIILSNEQIRQIWRLPSLLPLDNINQREGYHKFHTDGRPYQPHQWPLFRSVKTGEVVTEEEVIFLRGDETWGIMLVSSTPIYDPQGNIKAGVVTFYDISDRKQAEEALRQTETRLNVALKNSPISVFNQDKDLRYTWIYNPAFNYQVDDIIGKCEEELFNSTDVSLLTQIKRSVLETGLGTREEVKINMPDGDRYYDLTIEPLRDSNNIIIGITCAAINISERKQMELVIREKETVLNAFLTSSPMAMAFLDRDLRYIYANEALASVNGIPLEQHLERTVWEVLPTWASEIQAVVNQVLETKEPLLNQEVCGITNPPGVYRYGLVNYYPVYLPDGEVFGVGITSIDITELKQAERALRESEERYRSLVKASCQIVWRANGQGQLVEVQGWEEFTGQPVEELLCGSTEVIHPEDLERVKQLWWNAVESQSLLTIEHRLRKYDGTYEYFASRGIPVCDALGKIYAWVGMTTNIHQRKQAEIEREHLLECERKAREEAETANRIKDEFLAVLSHELRSPLNPILGWTQMLRTYTLDEKAIEQGLEAIERNAKLQTQLIEDLLDISRILRGKMALITAPIDLVGVIESALETVRLAAEAKTISIQRRLNFNVGKVLGDTTRLGQVVWNLLANAVKFTPLGGQIEISLERVNTYAQIQVKDTGKGINQEFLPHVFEYFRQEDSKTTRKYGGLGLGLALVRHITELHGGTVQAESLGENLGATFTVRLPLTAIEPTSIPDKGLPAEVFDLSQLQILVVDDEADMRELLVFILKQYGARVRVASSSVEALSILEQFTPDVLVSDIGMPDMDGYSLMQQIKALSSKDRGLIQAIALTAYAGELNKQKAIQAGFQKHLSKPVEPFELVRAIVSLVKK